MISKDISIVIPTRNRKRKLEKCLDSIVSQNYPIDKYEIIVVDDGSDDGTISMLKKYQKTYPNLKNIKLNKKNGPAKARNCGIKLAKGNIIGFTDSDCILKKEWIKKMVKVHYKYPEVAAVGGKTYVKKFNSNIKSNIIQFMSSGSIRTLVGGSLEVIFFPTCNVTLKKGVLEKEKFNERFKCAGGEDLEYFWRLYTKNYKLIYDNHIEVIHDFDDSIINFLNQSYLYGKENYLVMMLHPEHPALQDLSSNFFVGSIYKITKEVIKIPFLSLYLANRFHVQNEEYNYKGFKWICFYFIIFRTGYLLGNVMKKVKFFVNKGIK